MLAGVAVAHDDDGCFPVRAAVLDAIASGRVTERVFLEEWSTCEGAGLGGPGAVATTASGSSADQLAGIVTAYNNPARAGWTMPWREPRRAGRSSRPAYVG